MATQPLSLSYLLLDPSYDPVFAANTTLTGTKAVSQAILTRLNLFLGEWWEDLSLGLPVLQSMVAQLGSSRAIQAAQQAVIDQIMTLAPYVVAVTSATVAFVNGKLSVQVTVQTAFGMVTVQTAPGASAAI
jgi:hypothetical protein